MGQSLGKSSGGAGASTAPTAGAAPPPPCGYGDSGASARDSACPVPSTSSPVYNVYNERIDKDAQSGEDGGGRFRSIWSLGWGAPEGVNAKNNMPLEANQQPSVGQKKPLSISRESSSIPKGGTAATWQYPSPQMFFNALNRKGKAEGVEEDDMDSVIFFHNGMNERTWELVKSWEKLHWSEYTAQTEEPKLSRFRGRPHDLSPLARVRSWFSGEVPFDRHDWYVDRCGEEVRYVIDFYFDEDKAGKMDAFEVQARPALDSFTSCLDRVKMNVYVTCAKYGLPCPISGHPGTVTKEQQQHQQQ